MTVKWTVKRHALGKPLTCQKRKRAIPRVLKEPRRLLLSGQVTTVRTVNYCQDSKGAVLFLKKKTFRPACLLTRTRPAATVKTIIKDMLEPDLEKVALKFQ